MGLASINIKFQVDLREFPTEMQNSLRTIDKSGKKCNLYVVLLLQSLLS
jgi:hypothetical protein